MKVHIYLEDFEKLEILNSLIKDQTFFMNYKGSIVASFEANEKNKIHVSIDYNNLVRFSDNNLLKICK